MEEVPAEAAGQSPYTVQVSSRLLLHNLFLQCVRAYVCVYLPVFLSVRLVICLSVCMRALAQA